MKLGFELQVKRRWMVSLENPLCPRLRPALRPVFFLFPLVVWPPVHKGADPKPAHVAECVLVDHKSSGWPYLSNGFKGQMLAPFTAGPWAP